MFELYVVYHTLSKIDQPQTRLSSRWARLADAEGVRRAQARTGISTGTIRTHRDASAPRRKRPSVVAWRGMPVASLRSQGKGSIYQNTGSTS
jgi:hypothetical protein